MHTGKDPWDGMNMQQIIRAVSVYYRAPAVPETTHAHALLERCFQRNAVDRLSAGDLADAFAPPLGTSGARAVISELFEENDRLKVDNERLESELISCQALLLRTEEEKNLIEDGLARLKEGTDKKAQQGAEKKGTAQKRRYDEEPADFLRRYI
jgi:regulator of replication initiation timing